MPSNVAARMTLAADPESLQGAVAAGILGAGPVLLGTSEECAKLLAGSIAAGRSAGEVARGLHECGRARPGLRPPGAPAASTRVRSGFSSWRTRVASAGPNVAFARELRDAVAETWGKPLPMNVSMPIAAVLLDLGFPVAAVEVGADPRPNGEPARTPRRGAGAAARVHPRPGGRGRRPLRARCSSLRSRPARGGAARRRRRELPGAARLPARALRVLPGEARRARPDGRARRDRTAAAHREGRAARDAHARESVRDAPLRETRPSSSGSTRRAARRGRRATSRSRPATSTTGSPAPRAATPPPGSAPASGSSRRTTPGRSSPERRSPPSTGSASPTSPSAPATPTGSCRRSRSCGRRRPC